MLKRGIKKLVKRERESKLEEEDRIIMIKTKTFKLSE